LDGLELKNRRCIKCEKKKKTVVRISLILGYHKQKLVKISFLIEMMIDYATIFLLIGANYNKWSMFS
jgi:hypothetical protein